MTTPEVSTTPVPTQGRIVLYRLSQYDADQINRRRKDYVERVAWFSAIRPGVQVHAGNIVSVGDVFPAMIVQVWGPDPTSSVNLQVHLDGTDTYWATSRHVGEKDGDYFWPTRG